MIEIVAKGLGELLNDVIFVGGSIVELYADNPTISDIRPSLDVDCIIEISTRIKYIEFEDLLRKKKFVNDKSKGAPICRWIFEGIIVDIMPTNEEILGFGNIWYSAGIKNKIQKKLNSDISIFIFSPEYFLASKFEAHKNRGGTDLHQSHDFEDIIYIFDNVANIVDRIITAEKNVTEYLRKECKSLIKNYGLLEGIEAALPYGSDYNRVKLIKNIISKIANSY